jgi:putative peptide zinc metalloprotease protein
VMLVCSVSTCLFNANPLLRYDGYYVLSDLCDVPNLGERSRKLLAGHTNKLVFGFDELPPESSNVWARFWMLLYAIAATVYRWGLTLLILWFVSLVLRPYGLESDGRLVCLFAATGLIYTLLRSPARFLRNPARRRTIQMKRTTISMIVMVGLIAVAIYPLPSRVFVEARIIPRHENPIYISTPGLLRSVKALPGEVVSEGDEIATLVNHDVELQYLAAKGRFETQQQMVQMIRRSAIDAPQAANDLPGQEALLENLREQLDSRESSRAGLVIRAPISGTLIAAPRKSVKQGDPHRLVSWSGYPTDAQNKDCLMQPGHELMCIAEDKNLDSELILSQSEVDRVRIGAQVKLVLEAQPSTALTGKVTDISSAQWTHQDNADRRDDPRAAQRDQPPATSYVVRVQLDASELAVVPGAQAIARIETPPISMFSRASRFLSGLFRFR